MNKTRVVHVKKEPYDTYIGRSHDPILGKWGNPFTHKGNSSIAIGKVDTRLDAVNMYREWITKGEGRHLLKDLHELKGKVLGCWCSPQACHGDVLVELVEQLEE